MEFEQYFPLGIASEKAFIGREAESKWLQANIDTSIHSLLLGPRRYGKSSLVLNVLKHSQLQFVEIDLQLCRSAKSVEKKLLQGVQDIVSKTIKEKEKIFQIAKHFFKQANKQWNIGFKGFVELIIEPTRFDDVADNILTALQFLETTLAAENKRAIIFIDEVQEMIKLELTAEMQGAIRHFAQKSKRVIFIFSGSNRRMLREMFDDSAMPLYQLCDSITLGRIAEQNYIHYLRKISQLTWNKLIPDEIIAEIMQLSQRHPRRIYNLCLYFWRLVDNHPKKVSLATVQAAWKKLIDSNLKGIRYFLSQRNTSQLKVLVYVALGHHSELTGKAAQLATALSSTAISKALIQLEQDDLIERGENGNYYLIDPVMRDVLINYEADLVDC